MDKYKVEIGYNMIFVDHPTSQITLDKLKEIANKITNSSKIILKYGILKRVPGYYFSYNLQTNEMICSGVPDKNECIKITKLWK